MSNNSQKTHLNQSLNLFAQKKVGDALQLTGKSLPCSVTAVDGSIVTVKFEVNAAPFTLPKVTIPIFGPEWIRYPTQIGDKGVVFSVDTRIGNITGLGGSTPDFNMPANLTALVFFPVGSKNWSATDDPDALVLYGPNGVIIRDTSKNCTITVDQENITVDAKTQILMKVGDDASVKITDGRIDLKGDVYINDKLYLDHEHTNITVGSGNSGPVHDP